MSQKRFTGDEIAILRSNPNVASVSEKYITYTAEFKELCIANVDAHVKTLRQTFIEAGFDIDMVGWGRIRCAYRNWRHHVNHEIRLQTSHHHSGGHPKAKRIDPQEIIARKDDEIRRLRDENSFLRQLRRLERRHQPKKSPSVKDSNS